MFGERDGAPKASDLELLEELELNTPEEIEGARERDSLQLKIQTTLEPGNASARGSLRIQGVSSQMHRSGMTATFHQPVGVGDVYWLSLDRGEIDVPPCHALCESCRMVDDARYEVSLRFFSDIEIN